MTTLRCWIILINVLFQDVIIKEGHMGRGLDDTRNKIGANSMDNSMKKELFKKFTDHGGKIIDDTEARRQQQRYDKKKQAEYLKKMDSSRGRKHQNLHPELNSAALTKGKKDKDGTGARISILVGRMKLFMRSVFQNVTDFSGNYFSASFFTLLQKDAQNRLLDLKLLLTPLVHASPELKTKLQGTLSRLSSIYYELLLRMEQIYDERTFRELLARFVQSRDAKIPPKSIGEPLRDLYKKIWILRNFHQGCTIALTRSLEIQGEVDEKEKVAIRRNISHARKNLSFLFSILLPKLHLAFCNILKRNYSMDAAPIKELLELTEKDDIGFITDSLAREIMDAKKEQKKHMEDTKEKIKEEEKSIKVTRLQDSIQQGLALMRRLPISKERVFKGQDSPLKLLPQDNKNYLTQLLFREMEREYIFLLTSNQIKYSVEYHEGVKVDVKQQMGDLSIEFDHIHALFEEFNKTLIEKNGIENSTHSITRKNQLMHNITIKYSKLARQSRNRLGKLSGDIERVTRTVIKDHNNNGQLLQNPEDTITSDLNIGEQKKLEDKSVLTCLLSLLQFTSALHYRLTEGDLSGLGEKVDMVYEFEDEKPEEPPPPTE